MSVCLSVSLNFAFIDMLTHLKTKDYMCIVLIPKYGFLGVVLDILEQHFNCYIDISKSKLLSNENLKIGLSGVDKIYLLRNFYCQAQPKPASQSSAWG